MKIFKIPFDVEECSEIEMSPNGKLPFLMNEYGRCIQSENIVELLFERYDRQSEFEEFKAYDDLITQSLRPVWTRAMWAEDNIRNFILSPLYTSKSHCWPVRKYLFWRYCRMNVRGPAKLYDSYTEALAKISQKLGEKKYFGGEEPSVLDACIGADLILIPFFLPASHFLHKQFMDHHNLYEYSLHLLEYVKNKE